LLNAFPGELFLLPQELQNSRRKGALRFSVFIAAG
jgi:hypothetical protein